MSPALDHKSNDLLAALPADELDRLRPDLEAVEMKLGDVVHEASQPHQYVYFPLDCIISLVYVMQNGASAEVAVIGHEGLVGVTVLMGGGTMPNRAVVQGAGSALRIKSSLLRKEFDRGLVMSQVLMRFVQALLTQMAQTAVCNRHHTVDQQLCRWLLMSLDRLPANQVIMTQELIANMLGVRREGVTEAAGRLQVSGVIRYSRGHIEVLDRPKLERLCCECYDVVRKEYARLLPWASTGRNAPPALT